MSDGLVLRTEAGFCQVLFDGGRKAQVNLAKKIRQGSRTSTTSVVIGDRVTVRIEGNGGAIESVHERRNELARLAPGRRNMKDVLAANLDRLFIVHSLRQPDFNSNRLDRFLAIAEQAEIPATVVLNKDDLAMPAEIASIAEIYRSIGYPVVASSAKTGDHVTQIASELKGICAIIGPSGVGKSSILNRISPELRLRTGDISDATGKGKHTTVVSELLPWGNGSYVADTPGLRGVALVGIDRYEVAWLFREYQPYVGLCRFADCLHQNEPGCAVTEMVRAGRLPRARYESYLRLVTDVTEGALSDWET
jgi:ribosome biogenesis GTPase